MARFSPGEAVGQWQLRTSLGEGGNAEVWEATDGVRTVALKILKSRRRESEPYERFRREINVLSKIGPGAGVLHLVDSSLPDSPSKREPAWLAMPVASPLGPALSGRPLDKVVAAIAEVARTLAWLKREHGVHHRDIKPSNLYLFEGRAAIGDFGLVEVPGPSALTGNDRPLGPMNYMPYEMLASPATADPGPADVYALAKTLWVLGTEQRWPPPGPQLSSDRQFSIAVSRPHPRAHLLDQFIERATRIAPEDRPTMAEAEEDLGAWLEMPTEISPVPDLHSVLAALRSLAGPRLDAEARRHALTSSARSAARRLEELLGPLHAEVRAGFPEAEFDVREKLGRTLTRMSEHAGSPRIIHEDDRCTVIRGNGYRPISLLLARWVGVTEDGMLRARAACFIGPLGVMGQIECWQSEMVVAPHDSIAAEQGLVTIASEIERSIPAWLRTLQNAWLNEG